MALTLIKEDGTGKVDANSYADAADGDAYFEGHLYASAWAGAAAGDKELQLEAGTNGNQHIVSIKPYAEGTRFSLVHLATRGEQEPI